MNPLERIQSYSSEFTKTDQDIADIVLNDPREAARASIDHLAKVAHVSKSAVVRFSNRIGYQGFTDFKYDLARYLVSRNSVNETDQDQNQNPIHAITELYSRYISMIPEYIDADVLDRLSNRILNAKRVKLLGQNRTLHSAMQLRTRLAKIGLDAEAVSDHSLITDLATMMDQSDCVIVFTISDNTGIYRRHVAQFRENRCPVVCLTMNPSLPFRKQCSEYIVLPRISKDSAVSFLDDQAIYFVFIELLLDAIASKMQNS